jgi:hypothetical protein
VKLTNLEQNRAELLALVDAPEKTESMMTAAVRRTADWLMGRAPDEGDESNRKNLDDQLAKERYRADAARQFLPELQGKIETATPRVKRLDERESEFLASALHEVKIASGSYEFIARKRAEFEAAESILRTHPWHAIEDAMLAGKDIAKMLPKLKAA